MARSSENRESSASLVMEMMATMSGGGSRTEEPQLPLAKLMSKIQTLPSGGISGEQVLSHFEQMVECTQLLQLFPFSDDPAIISVLPRVREEEVAFATLSQSALRDFIQTDPPGLMCAIHAVASIEDTTDAPYDRRLRVGLVTPAHSAQTLVLLLQTMCSACAVPLNPASTAAELTQEMKQTGTQVVVVVAGSPCKDAAVTAAAAAGAGVVVVHAVGEGGLYTVASSIAPIPCTPGRRGGGGDLHRDAVLILRTTGTTGDRKMVPYSVSMLMVSAACLGKSRALDELQRLEGAPPICLNMLPMYHISGISRTLTQMLLGHTVMLLGGFEPSLFWEVLSQYTISYYAATTSMQQTLMDSARSMGIPPGIHSVSVAEIVCGALPGTLERSLESFFGARVVQGYAMTECMPIACPLPRAGVNKPGSVGVPVGPEVAILDPATNQPLPPGHSGQIALRGGALFRGYLEGSSSTADRLDADGWFCTGDLGHFDEDGTGALTLDGRSKEVIMRDGQMLSPVEIEAAVLTHPNVSAATVFAVPHTQYQETVGVALVMKHNTSRLDQRDIQAYLEPLLQKEKWPQVVVYMPYLEQDVVEKKNRIGFAEWLGLPTLRPNAPWHSCLFETGAIRRGTPRSIPLSASPIRVSTDQMRDAVLEQPGVGSATVRVQERRGKRSFVAYVTPSSIHGQTLKERMAASCVHGYCIPDVVIPVADLPNTGKGLEYHILNEQPPEQPFTSSFPEAHADMEQEGEQEEQEEVESPLGIIGKQSFQLSSTEQKVRDNAIVLFVMGIILDHTFECFASTSADRHDRTCKRIQFAASWVQTALQMFGGPKNTMGLLILAAYLQSKRGPKLQSEERPYSAFESKGYATTAGIGPRSYDLGMFIVYELSRYLYGWPFHFILGEDCEALGRFAHPRQIFVMILYSRLLIGGVYNLSLWTDRVAYQAFLNYICGFLLIVSCVWRDYHNTPLFDMCNLKYHSKPWCELSRLLLYTKHQCRDGTMLAWPDLCAYVACYIVWFSYARVLLIMANNRWQKAVAHWSEYTWLAPGVAFAGGYLALTVKYEDFGFDNPSFVWSMADQGLVAIDRFTVLRLVDVLVYSAQALAALFMCAQVSFHLQAMGENAVGVYVCQYVYIAVVRNPKALINTLDYIQRDDSYGSGVMAGIYQLGLIFGYQLGAWYAFGELAQAYIMAPFAPLQWLREAVRSRLRDRASGEALGSSVAV